MLGRVRGVLLFHPSSLHRALLPALAHALQESTTTRFTDTEVAPGSGYPYRVRALDAERNLSPTLEEAKDAADHGLIVGANAWVRP